MADDEDVLEWPVRTAEYMHFAVTASVNPLLDPVKVALPEHRADPVDEDYADAEWEPGQTWQDEATTLQVRYFVAAGTLEPRKKYDAWVQITDAPEKPEIFAGVVKGV